MVTLYPPQKQAVEKLAAALRRYPAALNASATGTGKTVMGLALSSELGRVPLVVAPLAAHATWAYWSREMGIGAASVVNPESLRTGKTPWVAVKVEGKQRSYRWNLLDGRDGRPGHLVLWDEMHRGLMGIDTQIGRMAATLVPQKIPLLLMSATPFASPLNMRSSGYALGLHGYSLNSFYDFCRRHGCRASHFHRGLEFNAESRLAKEHLRRINEFLQDRMVRLTVKDLGEFFGENVVEPTLVKLEERDRAEIEATYAEMDAEVKKRKHANPLVEMLRARQRAELLSVPAVADMVEDSVNEGSSVFVAQSFKDSVFNLAAALDARNVESVIVTGDVHPDQRAAAVDAFQADRARVLIGTIGAGGMSISLHRTRPEQRPRTSIIRPTYKADELIQATGRIYRAGMMIETVVQRIVLCAGTVEEQVYRRLMAKCRNIQTLTDADLA